MTTKRWLGLLWLLGGLALVLGQLREPVLGARHLALRRQPDDEWCKGGFVPNGVYPTTDSGALPAGVAWVGSWENGDGWQGEAQTAWLPASDRPLRVYVAGYPQHPGCRLWAEFRCADATIAHVACVIPNPHETWSSWNFHPPPGAESVRLIAEDHAADNAGWLAFSEPITQQPQALAAGYMAAQVFSTLALALTLVWGPGLCWWPKVASPEGRAAFLLGAGPLLLVAAGILIWVLDGAVGPNFLGFAFVAILWTAVGVRLWRCQPEFDSGTARTVALATLVVIAAVAKVTYAGGPEGELYGGTISRTLAVGDRSDARISFHVVQTAAHHLTPSSATAESYFSPWTFFSRGPLAGLAALPVVLATGGRPPLAMPDQSWTPFDPTGFAAYRIVLMALASMVIVALFAVLVPFAGERWALIGAGLLALCPFGVHDVMFTWPKWEATAWVLISFLWAHRRRPFVAGLALAAGFLFHPLALLWAPWLAIWTAARCGPRVAPFLAGGLRFSAGLLLLVVPWMSAGHFAPRAAGSTAAGQLGFFQYFLMADGGAATWASWWHSRAMNFNNTFLPFWLHLFNENHTGIGSYYGPVGPIVKFAFGWWNTLPLGLGLLLWALSLVVLTRAARRHAAAIGLLLIGPALWLTAYWGAPATGLMRECGHPLLAAIVGVFCVALAHSPGRLASFVAHPVFPWLQLPETLLMLWLTTFLNPHPPGGDFIVLSPLYFAINVIALAAAAWILARARAEKLLDD